MLTLARDVAARNRIDAQLMLMVGENKKVMGSIICEMNWRDHEMGNELGKSYILAKLMTLAEISVCGLVKEHLDERT